MPLTLDWREMTLRLLLSFAGAMIIGLERSQRGRVAGLRTTIFVGLAATVAMIQANLLLDTRGHAPDSFATLDLMRLPLGILTGMGFIGGGAILRRDGFVIGVTTAATLWFVTVMGLCFGGGQIGLGLVSIAIAWIVLTGLRHVEGRVKREQMARLVVTADDGMSEQQIRGWIAGGGYDVTACSARYGRHAGVRTIEFRLQWHAVPGQTSVPAFVEQLSNDPAVRRVKWEMPAQGIEGR